MSPLGEKLAWIVTCLGNALGLYARRLATAPQPVWIGTRLLLPRAEPAPLPPLPQALWQLFWNRFGRASRRFQSLYRQWQQGTLAPQSFVARTPRAPDPHPGQPRPEPRPTDTRVPRGFGWLHRRGPEFGPIAGMLSDLVQSDEARRFLTEVPRAGRLLRPQCHALGVPLPAWLALPRRPRKPRPARPRPTATRPLPLNHPDLGLQPWVQRWVRASRRKYGRD